MDDYLDALYQYLTEERLPQARSSQRYFIRCRQEEAALDALLHTLSPEQQNLYLRYEEFRNDLSSIEAEQLFRETFRLTREIYR